MTKKKTQNADAGSGMGDGANGSGGKRSADDQEKHDKKKDEDENKNENENTVNKPLLAVRVFTLFPQLFPGVLGESLTGKALEKGIWSLDVTDIRDFGLGIHRTVDDAPFGGGAGMVMKPDVLDSALSSARPLGRLLYLSPRGRVLDQNFSKELAREGRLSLLCGRYEGVDQRVLDAWGAEEVSIGDYILTGGELAAMVLLDCVLRHLPGVLGNADTVSEESFENHLLEYPHFTRPAQWTDSTGTTRAVPDVLLSGHHEQLRAWRKQQAENLTQTRRPDLWQKYLTLQEDAQKERAKEKTKP